MEELTSFHSFKLLPTPQIVTYAIYAILAILIIFILKNIKKTDKPEGCAISIYKALVIGLFGNMLLGVIYSSIFTLCFIIVSPKYEAEVISSVTHMEKNGHSKRSVQYPIFKLIDNKGNIIQKEGNEGVQGKLIINEKSKVAYQDGKLVTITIFSILIYVIILLMSLFVMCVLLFWTLFVS